MHVLVQDRVGGNSRKEAIALEYRSPVGQTHLLGTFCLNVDGKVVFTQYDGGTVIFDLKDCQVVTIIALRIEMEGLTAVYNSAEPAQ